MPSCSVCVSVTFVNCVTTNKDIFRLFSPSGSHTILGFPYQTGWQYADGDPPNRGIKCRWGRLKISKSMIIRLAINNSCTIVCISHSAATFLFATGIGRPSAIDALLCTVRDRPSAVSRYTQSRWTWIVCITARLDVTLKTTEQNRIIRTCKSEAEVTSNKKLHSRYCSIEANYWQTRSIAQPLCDSRATCYCILPIVLSLCCHTTLRNLEVQILANLVKMHTKM